MNARRFESKPNHLSPNWTSWKQLIIDNYTVEFMWFRLLIVCTLSLILFLGTLAPLAAMQGGNPTWRKVASPVAVDLYDAVIIDHDEAWAAGENGTILHYFQGKWQTFTSPVTTTLIALDAVSVNSVWAIDDQNHVLHFNGNLWSTTTLTENLRLGALDMMSDSSGWVASGRNALYYDGITWTTVAISMPNVSTPDWRDLEMVTPNNGWLVGWDAYYQNFYGVIVHFDGTQWSEFQLGNGWTSSFDGVSSIATDDVWLVGRNGGPSGNNGVIMHYTGTTFLPISITARSMLDIQMVTANDGWAVDNGGGIHQYDGTMWQEVTRPTTDILRSIAVALDGRAQGWIVGHNGIILQYGYTNYLPVILK